MEVSNIYALRTKNSPEKSFLGGKLAITGRTEEKPSSAPPSEKVPMLMGDSSKPVEDVKSFPLAPAPNFVAATSEIQDYRLDLGSPKTDQVISQFNDLQLQQAVSKESSFLPKIEKGKLHRNEFLLAAEDHMV